MMITINLLPQEYRKRERTPIVVFLPMLVGLVAVLSAGFVAAYVHFAMLSEAQNRKRTVQAELDQKAPNLRYEQSLIAEENEYKGRVQSISDIAASRIVMTKKLDELWTTISAGDATGDYLVWLQELKSVPPKATPDKKNGGPKVGGVLAMKGLTLADRDPLLDFNRFHAALKGSELFKSCTEINNPDGKISAFNDDRTPKKGWTVDLELTMLHPSELLKAAGKNGNAKGVAEKPGQKKTK